MLLKIKCARQHFRQSSNNDLLEYKCKVDTAGCEGKTKTPLTVISKLHFAGQSYKETTQEELIQKNPSFM
jgi:hypothetical protein